MPLISQGNPEPEVPALKEYLARLAKEEGRTPFHVVHPFNAGWARGEKGATVMLTEREAGLLAAWVSAVPAVTPRVEIDGEVPAADPPGAPPIPDAPIILNAALSSTAHAGGKGRKKGR